MSFAVGANALAALIFALASVACLPAALRSRPLGYSYLFLMIPLSVAALVCVSNILERVVLYTALDEAEEYLEILIIPFVLLFVYSWASSERLARNQAYVKQLHHRVKNDLQVVESLVDLQTVLASGRDAEILGLARDRVALVGAVERLSMEGGDAGPVPLGTLLRESAERMLANPAVAAKGLAFRLTGAEGSLPVSQALPCAVILGEALIAAPPQSSLEAAFAFLDGGRCRFSLSCAPYPASGYYRAVAAAMASQLGASFPEEGDLVFEFLRRGRVD